MTKKKEPPVRVSPDMSAPRYVRIEALRMAISYNDGKSSDAATVISDARQFEQYLNEPVTAPEPEPAAVNNA